MCEVRPHGVVAMSEEVCVLLKGACKSHLWDELLVEVEGDAAIHGISGYKDNLADV